MNGAIGTQVLKSIRHIMKSIETQSQGLKRNVGITGPQSLILNELYRRPELTVGELADAVQLAQATVTSIIDRLEARRLVLRSKGGTDKRKVYISLSPEGRTMLQTIPELMQSGFSERFDTLEPWEQHLILSCFQRVAQMMQPSDTISQKKPPSPKEEKP